MLITTGSQQALDLIAKVLIDPGSKVLVETPSYLGALQAFSLFEPEFTSVPTDEKGLQPEALTSELTAGARFLYALPNFQNPTGRRLPLERREALVARAKEQGVLIVEDDPYGELSYTGDQLPTLLSMNPDGVIYMGSFSKILAPGLRLGFVIAPPELHFKLCQAKQRPTCIRRRSRSAWPTRPCATGCSSAISRPSANCTASSARPCSTHWRATCPRA